MSTDSKFLNKINFKPEKSQLKNVKKNGDYCFFHDLIVNPCPYRYLQNNTISLSEEDYINLVNPRTEFYLCKKFEHSKDFQKLPQYILKRVAYFKPTSKKDELKMKENEIEFKNYDQVATELQSLELGKGSHRMLQLKSIIHQNTRLNEDKRFFYQKLRLPDRRNKEIRNICLILEEMNGGALSEYITKEHLFTENEIAQYTCQIAEGLIELRSKGIIHRDLRPENILFHNKQIKFADFDAAFIKDYSDYRNIKNGVDRKDTTPYEIMMLMAEEEEKLKSYTAEELYNMQKKADIYFLGVNMYSMIFCQMFESFNHRYINVLTQKKKRQGFNQKLLDLMTLCLQKNPERRIDLPEVISILAGVERQFYLKSPQYKRVYLSPEPLNLHSFSSNQIEQKLKSELALQKMKVSHNRVQMEKMINQTLRITTVERNTAYYQNLFRGILPIQDNATLWSKNSKLRKTVALQVRLQEKIQCFLQKLQIKAYYYEFIFRLLCEVNLACVRSVTHFDNIRSHIQLFSSELVVVLTFIYETIMKRSFTTDQNYEQSNPGYQNRRVICDMRVVHSRWQFFSGRLKLQKESKNHLKQLKKVLEEFNGSTLNEDDLKEAQIIEENHRMKFKSVQRVEKLELLIMKYKETSYSTPQQRLSFELQEKNFMKLMKIVQSNVKKQMVQTIISLILAYEEIKIQEWGHQSNLKNAIFMLMILQAQNTQTIHKNDLVLIKEQLSMMINLNLGWNSLQLQAFFSNYTQTHTDEVMLGIEELQSRMHIESQHQIQIKIEINPPQVSQNLRNTYNSPVNQEAVIVDLPKKSLGQQDEILGIDHQKYVQEEAVETDYALRKMTFDYLQFTENSGSKQKKNKRETICCEIIE